MLHADVMIAAHIIAQGSLYHLNMQFKNFLHFQILDAHTASSFSWIFWKELPQFDYKNRVFFYNPLSHNVFICFLE